MSAVCAFRMSQVDAIFDHGRFKVTKLHLPLNPSITNQPVDPTLTNFTLDAFPEILPESNGKARSLYFGFKAPYGYDFDQQESTYV